MQLHQVYKTVKCQLIYDPLTSRKRFAPLEGEGLPTNIFIEGDKAIRERYEVGTIFIASEVKVCKKAKTDTFYLRAKNQSLMPLSSLNLEYK